MEEDEIPCFLFLSVNQSVSACSSLVTSVFNNASTLLYTESMSVYNSFTCNNTFNPLRNNTIGIFQTYTFQYGTGDTGSVTLEEGSLNFFNLSVYLVFMSLTLILIVFMHKLKEASASSIVFGWMATAMSIITGAIIISPSFDVLKGVSLFISLDYYLATLSFVIALYTGISSFNIKNQNFPNQGAI